MLLNLSLSKFMGESAGYQNRTLRLSVNEESEMWFMQIPATPHSPASKDMAPIGCGLIQV